LRIIVLIEESRVEDAAAVLESVGFAADASNPPEVRDGIVRIRGELPEKDLHELGLIDGVRDWIVPSSDEDEDARSDRWPWKQKPETD